MIVELDSPSLIHADNEKSNDIEILNSDEICYSEFFRKYLFQNKPCLIKNITSDWECQKLWVLDGKPNLEYLDSCYGSEKVPVANCDEPYYNAQTKSTMVFRDYIKYLHMNKEKHKKKQCLYLKDWHFMKAFPEQQVYSVPKMFASDWLNEYLLSNNNSGDYRFVYMGPKGSWTPLHADVFSSYSWSVNICGRKKWVFYHPGQEYDLRDKFGKLVHSIDSEELKNSLLFPNYTDHSVKPIVLIQEVGDAVYVPSKWHHQVWNLEDTISINHNWINGCNIGVVWRSLVENLNSVKKEVEDCRDMKNWEEHCELILKSVYGMDISDFLSFIFYIAEVRLYSLENEKSLKINYSEFSFGKNHILFDLLSLYNVLKDAKTLELPCILNKIDKILSLISRIESYM